MAGLDALLSLGDEALLGRDPEGLSVEYSAGQASPDDDRLTAAEHHALERLLVRRCEALPPSSTTRIAIDLLPAAASLCRTLAEVDDLIGVACEWIDAMGDVRARARQVEAIREDGNAYPEAACEIEMHNGAVVVLDVHDASHLTATLLARPHPPIIIGIHAIDRDQPGRIDPPKPELTA